MINAKLIFKILGSLLNIEAAFMTLCLVLSLYYRENDMLPLAITVGVTIAAALCLLAGFRGLNIPYSKLINTIASATFGVYLIHDSNLVRPFLWLEVFRNASFQDSSYLIPYSVAVILIVYLVCTLLELVRSKIFMVISRGGLS